jgi:hypothetical protein
LNQLHGLKIKIKIYFFTENIKKGTFSFSFHFIGLVFYKHG